MMLDKLLHNVADGKLTKADLEAQANSPFANSVRIELKAMLAVKSKPTCDYSSPSWAYEQADKVGYTRALTDILQLIGDQT